MSSLNSVTLIGNLGKNPEQRFTQGGVEVCNFSIATSEKWTDASGAKKEETQWHNIVAWKAQATACGKYLVKGSKVAIVGKLKTRKWEKDGQTHYSTEVHAIQVVFLSPASQREGGGESSAEAPLAGSQAGWEPGPDSDIPF